MSDPKGDPVDDETKLQPADVDPSQDAFTDQDLTIDVPGDDKNLQATNPERSIDASGFSINADPPVVDPAGKTLDSVAHPTNRLPAGDAAKSFKHRGKNTPEMIGRYRIESPLGEGGFGRVYLAWDDDLQRHVTVKVPQPNRVRNRLDIQAFLSEARTLAKLEHPHVVPVHDVGHTMDGTCYIVSRYIDGSDLQKRIKAQPLSIGESVRLIATVAQAVHYAHTHGVIHRDIKPNNILLDKRGIAYLADFGLALLEEDAARSSTVAGTPAYMSPEQARGENHLVQGTSDTFSLGVVLYELIAGQRPFRGDNTFAVLHAIQEEEVQPLRELNREIPAELERICMKSLSKRASDRHSTALDLADDLNHFLNKDVGLDLLSGEAPAAASRSNDPSTQSSRQFLGIVPKGLRSFGADDAHFFLGLLPGPYDRDGTPESILFWRRQIEELDPEDAFRVGLIYGPSGCGKSSFVKAGLIPTLSDHVTPVVIEAAADATETRLLSRLRRSCPYLDTELGLRESIATLRHGNVMGEGKKVLLVIDQFEQWLYSIDKPEHSELAKALRQCDGEHVQCILMVRDDFWLAFSRFMDHLEVELMQNRNMAMIDLFDAPHARRVLTEFGRAFHRLPEHTSETSREQNAFVANAIDDLSENGKVTPVRLALFAEMIKSRPWTPSTLRKIGGTAGVGVMFLNENFVSETAPTNYRMHTQAVYATLAELLPAPGANLKGHMKSRDDLLEASGYADQPKQFQAMLRALDSELHLITRTDPEGHGDTSSTISASQSGGLSEHIYYQLAHDYLVPSIRQWQAQMQQGTRKGRAEMRIAQRAEVWQSRPDSRHLPTWTEWASIMLLTKHDRWDDSQRRMMQTATRRYSKTMACLAAVLLVAILGLYQYRGWDDARRLTNQLAITNVSQAGDLLRQLHGREKWTTERLQQIKDTSDAESNPHLFASLALLRQDPDQLDTIQPALLRADPASLRLICQILRPYKRSLQDRLWKHLEDEAVGRDIDSSGRPYNARLNAALALATFDPPIASDPKSIQRWTPHATYLANELVFFANIDRQFYSTLLELVRPISPLLAGQIARVTADADQTAQTRETGLLLLTDLFRQTPTILFNHITYCDADQINKVLPLLEKRQSEVRPILEKLASRTIDMREPLWKRHAKQKATATALLLRWGASNESIWSAFQCDRQPNGYLTQSDVGSEWVDRELKRLLHQKVYSRTVQSATPERLHSQLKDITRFRQRVPNARTVLVQRANELGVDADLIARRLLAESDIEIRCGLIQALGNYEPEDVNDDVRDQVLTAIKGWSKSADQANLHANTFWFLNQPAWGSNDWVGQEMQVPTSNIRDTQQWYVNQQGQTMIRLPQHEPQDRYRLEVGMGEVTKGQVTKLLPEAPLKEKWSGDDDCAIGNITYHDAVKYCNRLSLAEGLSEDQLCYPNSDEVTKRGAELHQDYTRRTGYRLPTAEEYFFMCHAGCLTDFSFGSSRTPSFIDPYEALWDGYSANQPTDGTRSRPMGDARPNQFGVFDSYMNVREWTSTINPSEPSQRQIGGMDFRYHWSGGGVSPNYIGWGDVISKANYWGFRVVRSNPKRKQSD